jgi:hypothetical protein
MNQIRGSAIRTLATMAFAVVGSLMSSVADAGTNEDCVRMRIALQKQIELSNSTTASLMAAREHQAPTTEQLGLIQLETMVVSKMAINIHLMEIRGCVVVYFPDLPID